LNVVNIDPISDLAVLEPVGKSTAARVLKLAERTDDLKEGDKVVHACYSKPSELRPQWREQTGTFRARGTVFQLLAAMEHEDYTSLVGVGQEAMSLELVTEPGQSGSPVMNENHEVIGVLMGGRGDEKVSLVMPVEAIHEIMQSR
jgi:S1-C subfamily serine protease